VFQHCGPGQTLSNVSVRGLAEIDATLLDAIVTVKEGEGSLDNFTFIVAVPPSLTVVDAAERIILIELVSTVLMLTVFVPRSVPFPVIVTVSETVLASLTPVKRTD
jgi:hypothetical protein